MFIFLIMKKFVSIAVAITGCTNPNQNNTPISNVSDFKSNGVFKLLKDKGFSDEEIAEIEQLFKNKGVFIKSYYDNEGPQKMIQSLQKFGILNKEGQKIENKKKTISNLSNEKIVQNNGKYELNYLDKDGTKNTVIYENKDKDGTKHTVTYENKDKDGTKHTVVHEKDSGNVDNQNHLNNNSNKKIETKEESKNKKLNKNLSPEQEKQIKDVLGKLSNEEKKEINIDSMNKATYEKITERFAQVLKETIVDHNKNLNDKQNVKDKLKNYRKVIDDLEELIKANKEYSNLPKLNETMNECISILENYVKKNVLSDGNSLLNDKEEDLIKKIQEQTQEIENAKNKINCLQTLANNKNIRNDKKEQIVEILRESNTNDWSTINKNLDDANAKSGSSVDKFIEECEVILRVIKLNNSGRYQYLSNQTENKCEILKALRDNKNIGDKKKEQIFNILEKSNKNCTQDDIICIKEKVDLNTDEGVYVLFQLIGEKIVYLNDNLDKNNKENVARKLKIWNEYNTKIHENLQTVNYRRNEAIQTIKSIKKSDEYRKIEEEHNFYLSFKENPKAFFKKETEYKEAEQYSTKIVLANLKESNYEAYFSKQGKNYLGDLNYPGSIKIYFDKQYEALNKLCVEKYNGIKKHINEGENQLKKQLRLFINNEIKTINDIEIEYITNKEINNDKVMVEGSIFKLSKITKNFKDIESTTFPSYVLSSYRDEILMRNEELTKIKEYVKNLMKENNQNK